MVSRSTAPRSVRAYASTLWASGTRHGDPATRPFAGQPGGATAPHGNVRFRLRCRSVSAIAAAICPAVSVSESKILYPHLTRRGSGRFPALGTGFRHAGSVRLDDLPVPETVATRSAEEVLRRYAGPALVNHAVRSALFAAAYGRLTGVAYDPELLQVAGLLHDLGLEAPFDSHRLPFEVAGGELAWVFGAGLGWPVERRQRLADIVVRHMWRDVDPAVDPEGHLLERATSLDISGRRLEEWPASLRAEVLARWPRLDLAERFTARFADQAARKPESTAAAAMRWGLGERIAANPLKA
jgi:hypothetical protein